MSEATEARLNEENPGELKRRKWSAFVETDVVEFFDLHELEKMSIEDGNGNKAKLSRTKDNAVKAEHSSTVIL